MQKELESPRLPRLTRPQARILADVQAAGADGRGYNGRARQPIATLEKLGLVTVERRAHVHAKGGGIDISQLMVVHAAKPLSEKHDELISHVVSLVNECAASLGFHCLLKTECYQLVGPRKNWKVEIRTAHTYQSGKREGARIIVHSAYYGNEGRATFPIKSDGSFNAPGVARRLLNNLGLLEEVA